MDLLAGVVAALVIGLPVVGLLLSQATADVSGYLNSTLSRDSATGSAWEVGTSGASLTGVPASSTEEEVPG